jgi:hypothetical protein
MSDQPGQIGHSAGPSGRWPGDVGKPIAEGLTIAGLVLASPSRQAHPQRDRRPLSRQILQMANLPAVPTGGLSIIPRTSSVPLSEGRDCPAPVAALGTQELEARSQRPFGIFDHATSTLSPSQTSSLTAITRIEEDPIRCSVTEARCICDRTLAYCQDFFRFQCRIFGDLTMSVILLRNAVG